MKKAGTFMIEEVMSDLENEADQMGPESKETYLKILERSSNWAVPEKKPESDIWYSIENKISVHQAKVVSFRPWIKWAASIALLLTATAVWFTLSIDNYTYTAEKFQVVTLPDGSKVSMDVGSYLSYEEARSGKRKVELEGLAYFDVVEGKPFEVRTKNGSVQVLGTTFNVNSFGEELRVECLTGKVMVEAHSSVAVLTPGSMIKTTEGELGEIEGFNLQNGMSWMTGEFHYQNALLTEVITEIERQFDINIDLRVKNRKRTYSGLFNKEDKLDDVLKLITVPMGLDYQKTGNKSYQVID